MKTYSRKNSSYLKKAFIASNFNEMCRLCLSEVDLGLTPIFQEYSKISYQEWIQYSVDVMIEEGDGLPSNICEECLAMVEQTYLFKKKCKASDSKLREHLELLQLNEEGKLNEIGLIDLAEDHRNLFKKEAPSESNCNESSKVDSGGTVEQPFSQELSDKTNSIGCFEEQQAEEEEEAKTGEKTLSQNLFTNSQMDCPQPEEKIVIQQVKRYILKGEKGEDGQEEDLSVCEVVPLDVRNEESVEIVTNETLTHAALECVNQNGLPAGESSPHGMRTIQEIYQLWSNEEEGEGEQRQRKIQDGIMILDVSWEDGTDKSVKKQNVGLMEVDVEQNGVVQLHRVYSEKNNIEEGEKKEEGKTSKCFVCGSLFDSSTELKEHLSRTHREVSDGAFCEICGKNFTFNNNLKRHMAVHTGYKPHKCKICERTFSQMSILKRHVLTHETLKPFNCHICGKGYTQKMNLVTHFRLHGFRTGKDIYKCKLCKKTFMHQSGLSRHLKAHKGVRFTCEHCKKTFGDSSALARHVKAFHQHRTRSATKK